jgi:hypothetical protein
MSARASAGRATRSRPPRTAGRASPSIGLTDLRAGDGRAVGRPERQDGVPYRGGDRPARDQPVHHVLDGSAADRGELEVAEGRQELSSERLLVGAKGGGLVGVAGARPCDASLCGLEPLLGCLLERRAARRAERPAVQGGLRFRAPRARVREGAEGLPQRLPVPRGVNLPDRRAAVAGAIAAGGAAARVAEGDALRGAVRAGRGGHADTCSSGQGRHQARDWADCRGLVGSASRDTREASDAPSPSWGTAVRARPRLSSVSQPLA